jgi:hypothetical protein
MFAYNPTVNNQAGSIMGAGIASAAATDAQAKGQMGNDILGALLMVSKAYTDNETQKAEGKAFLNTLGIMAPALGINEQQLAELKKSFKTPQEAAAYGRQVLAVAPSLINRNMAVMRPNNQMRVASFQGNVDTITDYNKNVNEGDVPLGIDPAIAQKWGSFAPPQPQGQ